MRVFTDKRTGEQYVEIPTRAPVKMQMYAKTLSFATGKTLKTMYKEAGTRFIDEKPWDNGLAWRPTKGLTTTLKDTIGQKEPTGWMQVNMRFPVEIGNKLDKLSTEQGVSLSSICYTLLYWWTWWVYPPASERRRRDAFMRKNG
jgi:predicted DNA-binding protein